MTFSPSTSRRGFQLSPPVIVALGLLAVVLVTFAACQLTPKAPKDPYRFGAVTRGDEERPVGGELEVTDGVTTELLTPVVDEDRLADRTIVRPDLDPHQLATGHATDAVVPRAGEQAVVRIRRVRAPDTGVLRIEGVEVGTSGRESRVQFERRETAVPHRRDPRGQIDDEGSRGIVDRVVPEDAATARKVADGIAAKTKEYEDRFANPFVAAGKGFIDEVIYPHSTRRRIALGLRKLRNKQLENPWKKHDNIPL